MQFVWSVFIRGFVASLVFTSVFFGLSIRRWLQQQPHRIPRIRNLLVLYSLLLGLFYVIADVGVGYFFDNAERIRDSFSHGLGASAGAFIGMLIAMIVARIE